MSFVISRTQYDLLFKKILKDLQPYSIPELQLQKLGLEVTGQNENFKPPIHRLNDVEVCLLACLAGNTGAWIKKDVLRQQCSAYANNDQLSQAIKHLINLDVLVDNNDKLAIMPIAERRVGNVPPPITASLFSAKKRAYAADATAGLTKKQKIAALEAKQTQLITDFANATADNVFLKEEVNLMLAAIAERNGIEAANRIEVKITQGQRFFTVSPNSAFTRVSAKSSEAVGLKTKALSSTK